MDSKVLLLTVKVNLKNDIQIEAEDIFTIETIKEIWHSYCDILPENQKIVYKGKVLKDHETLSQCGVASGETLYLVTVKTAQPQGVAYDASVSDLNMQTGAGELAGMMRGLDSFGMMSRAQNFMETLPDAGDAGNNLPPGMNMQQLSQMLRNPMVMNMITNMLDDPQTFQTMINADPRMQEMFSRNPELREAMNTPQVRQQLRQNLERMSNSNGGVGPMMGAPGSLPAPGSAETPAAPSNPTANAQEQPPVQPPPNFMPFFNPFAPAAPVAPGSTETPSTPSNTTANTSQQPPVQTPPSFPPFFNPYAAAAPMMPFGGSQPAPAASPEEQYASQLQQLRDMGFTNDQTNIQVLQTTGGNVEAAVERLFNMLGNS